VSRQVVARAGDIAPGTCKIVSVRGREIGIFNLDGEYFALTQSLPTRRRPTAPWKNRPARPVGQAARHLRKSIRRR
jgi:hypothetical protein